MPVLGVMASCAALDFYFARNASVRMRQQSDDEGRGYFRNLSKWSDTGTIAGIEHRHCRHDAGE
jgi:hypothetical protein